VEYQLLLVFKVLIMKKNYNIGRGGSDASAIMIAKFFKAERCIIYTDVEGVYTTDPNKLKKQKKLK
jgi:aspartate kinase